MSDFNVPGSRPKKTRWNFGNRPYSPTRRSSVATKNVSWRPAARKSTWAWEFPPLRITSLLESNPPKSKLLVGGLGVICLSSQHSPTRRSSFANKKRGAWTREPLEQDIDQLPDYYCYYTILYYTILYYTILYYTILLLGSKQKVGLLSTRLREEAR